jgi:hypothetical protein
MSALGTLDLLLAELGERYFFLYFFETSSLKLLKFFIKPYGESSSIVSCLIV